MLQKASLIFSVSFLLFVNTQGNPQIEIGDGKIEGSVLLSRGGREINAFQGIPFAEPPVGSLRFKSPVPNKPWEDVLDGTKTHAICPQNNYFLRTPEGNEDCLYLNVYTPKLPSENSKPLPVMVFFHGGGFIVGAGTYKYYGPEVLLDHDIVLVISNYRLGTLGFLSTGDEASPGNYGLKDQALALKWVNKNIKHFGGDPKSVTIFGESAGAASTHLHMFSSLSNGLYKGVISQSGTAFNKWVLTSKQTSVENIKKLAEYVGCPIKSNEEIVECLRNTDVNTLLEQESKFKEWGDDPMAPFTPVVEPPSPEAFLTDTPLNILKTGQFVDVPWLVGMTADEGLLKSTFFLVKPEMIDELNEDFNNKAALSLGYKSIENDIDSVGEEIKKFYFGGEKVEAKKSFEKLTQMYSDGWFTEGLDIAIRNYRKVSKKPIYNYLFGYKGSTSFTTVFGGPVMGVCHADDLFYLFPDIHEFFPNRKETEEDKKVTKLLTTLWVNFAKTGNPTPEINDVVKSKWKPVKSDKLEYFYIDGKVQEMRDDLFEDRVKFWRSLPFNSGKSQKEEL